MILPKEINILKEVMKCAVLLEMVTEGRYGMQAIHAHCTVSK